MSEWREMRLGELGAPSKNAFATGPFGSAIASKFFRSEGVPVIRGSNLSADVGSRLITDEFVYVSEDKADQHGRSIAVNGDLVFTCWGTIGQVGFVDGRNRYDRFLISNKQMKMTPDPARVDGLFLYYLLSSPAMVDAVRRQAIGAAVPGFNLGQLRDLRVAITDLLSQRRIAILLRAFDDLIKINERRIELLEDLARSLYQEWFVRFRFPGHEGVEFVDSDLGPVPEGWSFRRLGDVAVIDKGLSYKGAHLTGAGDPMANLKCLKPSGGFRRGGTKPYSGGYKQRHAIAPGDLVVANTDLTQVGNVIGSPAIVPRRDFEQGGLLSHHLFAVRPLDGPAVPFLFHVLAHDRFRNFARERASGTTVLGLRPADIADYAFADPPAALRNLFTQFAAVVNDFGDGLEDQNENLAATRDLLLPRLVTGRLDISDVDLGALLPAEAA